jgi:flagellar basal-body rod protein FlgB
MRQEIISSNVANADTPGYKAKRIEFEQALARALDVDGQMGMKVEDGKHFDVGNGGFENLQPEVIEDPNGIVSEEWKYRRPGKRNGQDGRKQSYV